VGEGIAASGVDRSTIFLTTKLNNTDHKDPEQALFDSLKKLNTPYLDLWLMHWPAPMTAGGKADKSHNWLDTWKSMEQVYKNHPDKVKAIGVSNISIHFFEELFKVAEITPAVNQVELHPACAQQDLVDYCLAKGIVVTAYSPLGSDDSPLLENPIVKKLATKYEVQPANVLLSVQARRPGVNVITKSVTPHRITSNLQLVDLTDEEVAELLAINKTHQFRACNPEWTGWGHLGFPDRMNLK